MGTVATHLAFRRALMHFQRPYLRFEEWGAPRELLCTIDGQLVKQTVVCQLMSKDGGRTAAVVEIGRWPRLTVVEMEPTW